MKNEINSGEVPLGLGMALAQNVDALNSFASLTPEKCSAVINRAHNVSSKQEMHSFVNSIANGSFN